MIDNRLQRRHPLLQTIMDNWFYILLIVIVWQLPYWLRDYFDQELSPRRIGGNQPVFWMGIVAQFYILAILAMSYNLIFGYGGILNFGHALFFGMGVYVLVILTTHYAYSIEVSMMVGVAVGLFFGLLMALAVIRIKGVYFAMFSLAMAQIFFDFVRVNLFKFLTNGDDGIAMDIASDHWLNPISNRLGFYYICGFFAILTFFAIRRLINSPTGKVILAIRDNEERALTMGYNTYLYKTLILAVGSTFAALAGVLQALFNRQAEPTALAVNRTIDPLFMTIIGGTGTNPGPVVGAAVLHFGEEVFRKEALEIDLNFMLFHIQTTVDTVEIWRLILGIVFILIVLLIPQGVVGQINLLWVQIRRWIRQFVYDPIIRSNPNIAERMQPLTGESPAIAQVLAQNSKDKQVLRWAMDYPWAASYSIAVVVASILGIITWDSSTFFSWLLFLGLIATIITIVTWLPRNYQKLWQNVEDFFAQFGISLAPRS